MSGMRRGVLCLERLGSEAKTSTEKVKNRSKA